LYTCKSEKKKRKCQFAKDSSVNFACLYNSVKRLFPFICGQFVYVGFFFSLLHATSGETRFCRGSFALCASADTMTDETSRSDNCRLNLGLNDFSHERERHYQYTRRIRKILHDFNVGRKRKKETYKRFF